jgi:hypothetical protein
MDQSPVEKPNRRAARRRAPKGCTRLVCHKGLMGLGADLAVALLDVSEYGARVLVQAALAKGQEIEIELESLAHSRPLKRLANVTWCVPTIHGSWCAGVRFQKILTYADLHGVARV